MRKILHVVSTPRKEKSRTLMVSDELLKSLEIKYPGVNISTLNLFEAKLPDLTVKSIDGKFILMGGKDLPEEYKAVWSEFILYIEQFLSSDLIVISSPMWNFSIPYVLKHYIDVIIQPKYLFKYTENGPEGLANNKKMVIITSRGGDYSAQSPFASYDQQIPYLKTVFGFVGIKDPIIINAQPMDGGSAELKDKSLEKAINEARLIAEKL